MRTPRQPLLSTAALATALAMTAALLPAPPAVAAPAYDEATVGGTANYFSDSIASCSFSGDTSDGTSTVPVAENGAAVAVSASTSGTLTSDDDATDSIGYATSMQGTASLTSAGGNPKTMDLRTTGSVSANATKTTSQCRIFADSEADFQFDVVVSRAGFLLLDYTTSGYGSLTINIDDDEGEVLEIEDVHRGGDGTHAVLLVPGTYDVDFGAGVEFQTSKSVATAAGSATVHGEFALVGSQTSKPSGSATKFVGFATSRNCSSDTVRMTVKKGPASRIASVVYSVNGKKVKKLKFPKGGTKTNLPIAETVGAEVRAKVKLKPAGPGAKPEKAIADAAYLACG
jgi:hypothetical protein